MEPTNTDRARWAKEALAVFTERTFSGDRPETMHRDDLGAAISDLIADLLHFAEAHGFDAGQLPITACCNFEWELRQEATLCAR